MAEMSFEGIEPAATGRPSYHLSVLLKLYIYGYLNRVQSSRLQRGGRAAATALLDQRVP
jgi:transposase